MSRLDLNKLSTDFDSIIQLRGERYQQDRRVRLDEVDPGDPGRVLAFVQGTRRYSVQIGFEGLGVRYSCSCPYFQDREQPCKHLWAVLLELKDRGFFLQWQAARFPEEAAIGGTVEQPALPAQISSPAMDESGRTEVEAEWRRALRKIRRRTQGEARSAARSWPPGREVLYVFDIPRTLSDDMALVHLYLREGGRGLRAVPGSGLRVDDLMQLPDPRDREILGILRGGTYQNVFDGESRGYRLFGQESRVVCSGYYMDVDLVQMLLPKMAESGRMFLKRRAPGGFDPTPVSWDPGPPWQLRLLLGGEEPAIRLEGVLIREKRRLPLSSPDLILRGGLMFAEQRLCRYDQTLPFTWVGVLRRLKHLSVKCDELSEFFQELLSLGELGALEIDPSLGIRTTGVKPEPRLTISRADGRSRAPTGGGLAGELSFAYREKVLPPDDSSAGSYFEEEKLLVLRDRPAEQGALRRLLDLGFRRDSRGGAGQFRLAVRRMPEVVERLLEEGWRVEAEGRVLRSATAVDIHVVSGIDWFEVHGGVRFGDTTMPFPDLLKALRKGGDTVRLGDGSYGVLPEQWLRKQGFLLDLGEVQADHLRFGSSQALLIELLLQAQPQASCDEVFENLRTRLSSYRGIEPADAPGGFVGSLRAYQKDALGWFAFLEEFCFGGCLADDMGLGKTVQVLALLERRRGGRPGQDGAQNASLVVVPKSLIFNWREEAARFTPQLTVLEHTGSGRARSTRKFSRFDVVLTTYGTMRNDISLLKEYRFDCIVLDEAQVIKNSGSLTAKAARLLRGSQRLALSGTPIENHLGELWSLFEFLNPGMLGGVSFFRRQLKSRGALDAEARSLLSRYLRPFILRRTKEQVAPELPEKVEQTLFCRLEAAERRRYDQLKRHYQRALDKQIADKGLAGTRIQVLEALLRLRQAACHPGLLDEKLRDRSSAKLDLLLQQLEDVAAEERKALVFSQFTSLLGILRQRLAERELVYEYLDGRTRDRARRVRRFQEDPDCPLFLISLKAGGLGLNLTAAEYVFLLDPWWNPAVEAQAIDRTHRIGQDKKVFAYRLIAKDTVEEKVLDLQQSKRELADAIISQDRRLIGQLSREDLALLLS